MKDKIFLATEITEKHRETPSCFDPSLCSSVSSVANAFELEAFHTFPPLIAVNIPCISATGVGGHPGTATSTGITFDTRPRLA